MGVPQALRKHAVPILVLFTAALAMMMTQQRQVRGQSPEGTVRIMPPISTAPIEGGPFDVYVVLENLQHFGTITYDDNLDGVPDRGEPSTGMGAFEFTLEFDPALVALEAAAPGPDLTRSGRNFQCLPPRRDEPNEFTFGCISLETSPAGPQGSLTLATVTVRPLARGSSPLLLDAGLAGPLGDDAPVQGVGGVVRMTGSASATPTIRPGVTPVATRDGTSTVATPTASPVGQPSQARTGTATSRTPSTSEPAASRTPSPTLANPEANSDDGGTPGAAFWSLIGVGVVVAVGGLGLATAFMRRGKR